MCGGGNDASREAKRTEAKRQATISGNVANINSAFAGREPQYADLGNAIRNFLNSDLTRQRENVSRDAKFSLARSGLTGGSAAVDLGKNIAREAQRGAVDVERQARSGMANLRSQDEQARNQMISLAQSGSNIGNAAAQTAAALRANLEGAKSANISSGLGDVFGTTATAIKNRRDANERRRGYEAAGTYANPFSRGP